jgi:hypothetical protein
MKNHKLLIPIVIVGTILIGIAAFPDTVNKGVERLYASVSDTTYQKSSSTPYVPPNATTSPTRPVSSTTTKTIPSTPKIGSSVRDGKFEFVINSIECGIESVGNSQYLTKSPQGQYCKFSVTVKNIGDIAQKFYSSNQFLFNSSNQRYSNDSTAQIYASAGISVTWINDINPGNSVTGDVYFDIPKDQIPTSAELHDSSLSAGVKVKLQ